MTQDQLVVMSIVAGFALPIVILIYLLFICLRHRPRTWKEFRWYLQMRMIPGHWTYCGNCHRFSPQEFCPYC